MQTKSNDVNRTELLQKTLLEYLAHGSENDPSLVVSVSVLLYAVCYLSYIFNRHMVMYMLLISCSLFLPLTGKRMRGRKRLQLMSNMCEGYETAKKRAEDRCLWCVSVMGVIHLLLQQNTRRIWLCIWYIGVMVSTSDWQSRGRRWCYGLLKWYV